jgi:hypothetical protein
MQVTILAVLEDEMRWKVGLLALGIVLIQTGSEATNESNQGTTRGLKLFQTAEPSDDLDPLFYTVSIGGHEILVTWGDHATKIREGGDYQIVELDLAEGFFIARVWFAEFNGDLVLVYQETDREGAAGSVTRVDGGKLVPMWTARIPTFNVGEPIMAAAHVYVTAEGFMGKLDLETAKYSWRHDMKLDRRLRVFSSFERPRLEGNRVIFKESFPFRQPAKRVEVDDRTGEIVVIH